MQLHLGDPCNSYLISGLEPSPMFYCMPVVTQTVIILVRGSINAIESLTMETKKAHSSATSIMTKKIKEISGVMTDESNAEKVFKKSAELEQ